jgi:hypothetical protein
MAKKPPPFRTNPSTVARYFFHDCERFLYFSAASPEQRKREGLPDPAFERSPLVEAILESGYAWEREVVEKLLAGRVVLGPGAGELHLRRLPPEATLRALEQEPAGRFLYQPTLSPPALFYETYDLDPGLVVLSDNHPDLVEILPDPLASRRRLLRVLDVKRGETLRLTHRVQILLYALELQALLDAEGIDTARVDLEHGGVWLGQQPQPEVFRLSDFRPHLERFLREDLMRILEGEASEASWHLYERCEWCEFFEHCRDEMRRTDDVSRLVQLTPYGKRHLREEAGVSSLRQLGRFLKRADADEVLSRCASLAGQRHQLAQRVQALVDAEPRLLGAASAALPQGENMAMFLTLQKEPLSQAVYLAGLYVQARDEVRDAVFPPGVAAPLQGADGKNQPALWLADTPDDVAQVRREFVLLLYALLNSVHRYNEARPEWRDQLSLQAYVQTEEERELLFATLLEALHDEELAEQALTLLFHFQGPELLHADQHPGQEVHYPVVVLKSAVNQLLALPVEVSHTLPEMLGALGSSFHYRRRDYYHFPLGSGLRAESVHAAWYRGQTQNLDEIRQQGRLYLIAVAALLRAVREKAGPHLFTWPAKFALPAGTSINDPLLSRLAFFARHESLLGCVTLRESRAEAVPTQVQGGQAIPLVARSASEMEVVGELLLEPEPSGFPQWLLVRDSPEGRRAQLEYADYGYRNRPQGGPRSPHRAIAGVRGMSTRNGVTRLTLEYTQDFEDNPPAPGEHFLLYERFTDFSTDGVVRFLEHLDGEPDCLFLELLRHPEETATPLPLPRRVASLAGKSAKHLGLTPSQAAAYEAIREQRVTAVWGPPGTGKTHFLASIILALADAHARAGFSFRVLVTAYTHAAIENLLRKLAERRDALELAPVALAKVKHWQGTEVGIDVVPESELGIFLDAEGCAVVGATVYSCLKQQGQLPPFDLVVIDEASQVRVPEAAVAVSLAGSTGRLVLAGDHRQLPPIVKGRYPEPLEGEPLLHRSIFEAVYPHEMVGGKTSRILRPLLENFRMNDVLTSFAAGLLYGRDYHCASDAVARRRLPFVPRGELDELVEACLSPEHPLVLVVLDGIHAAQSNPIEADLVAQMVTALRDGLRDDAGRPYASDAEFFRHGVFVVSPHHAQIREIQRELARQRTWRARPFVDTVDKMQGQEAEAVIVSYGVADPELALREAEFIYGLNRLNVAITRARSKCIVCLPRPLLDASPQVLDREPAAAGLAFMRQLVAGAQRVGEELTFEAEDFEAWVVRAARGLEV